MKANEFIKKYGVGAAMDLWCGAFDLYNNDLQILNGMVCSFSNNQFLFELVDLKHLIDSHELINSLGGVEQAKSYAIDANACGAFNDENKIKQAILDVESCQ